MKILSIVVPTYNVEKYLERCIDSLVYDEKVLNDLEILIVNDGSKDNSLQIAKKYEKQYPNTIKVIDKENGGHGSTINAGLKVATGKYFRVIDSDDWVNVDDFSNYVKDLKKYDCDLVVTNYSRELIYAGESVEFKYSKDVEFNKVYDIDKFDLATLGDDYFFMATTTFKTDLLRKANVVLDEKTFYVDMEFILFPIPYVKDFVLLDYDIYIYFIGRPDQSVNINSYIRNRSHHEKVLRKLVTFYESTKMSENKKKYIFKILCFMCNSHYVIYCKAKLPDKKAINEVREFDKFLRGTSPSIYETTSNMYRYIKSNRKTNFRHAQGCKNLYSRIADRLERRKRGN